MGAPATPSLAGGVIPALSRGRAPEPAHLRTEINAWLSSPALKEALAAFDGPVDAVGADPPDVDAIAAWISSHWDFRAGQERNLVDPETIRGDVEATVIESARRLGLVDPLPPVLDHYDHVLMLGGLVRACMWRPAYTATLLANGTSAAAIAAITGFRALNDAERPLLAPFKLPDVEFEHQIVDVGLRRAFGVDSLDTVAESPADSAQNARFLVARGIADGGVPVSFVVAPSGEPEARRANTVDGYRFWAEQVAGVAPGAKVLMVTSTIYVPFQHADALRILGLPYGCAIDTVGIDHAVIDTSGVAQEFRGVNYLQEINSAVRSFKSLLEALPEA